MLLKQALPEGLLDMLIGYKQAHVHAMLPAALLSCLQARKEAQRKCCNYVVLVEASPDELLNFAEYQPL
jgi:hypothetical protein